MKETEIVLGRLPQADGLAKIRPALVLRHLPPYQDSLLCGISTQLQHYTPHFDEILLPSDADFAATGLRNASVIRLGFLSVVPSKQISGIIGTISPRRHERLLRRLSEYLVENFAP